MRRHAAKATPQALPRFAGLGEVIELPFAEIVAIDDCNARRKAPSAQAIVELAADIAQRGLLNPLILRGAPGGFRVLAGGRRWRALKSVAKPGDLVRAQLFYGDDEDAAALSLAENIDREDLHPLEEADRVAEFAAHESLATVARRLSRPERWLRARAALSALPEAARQAWIEGEIGLAEAQAFSAGEPMAVAALFASGQARALLGDVRAIRAALAPKGVSSRAPVARFVGIEAYVAAGGAVREDLFSDEALFLDVELLRRLERQKLAEAADGLCEREGWGTQLFDPADARRTVRPDFTAEEQRALEAADAIAGGDLEALESAEAKANALHEGAVLRAVAQKDRARYGLYVGLDSEGRLDVARGVLLDRASPEIVEREQDTSPHPAPLDAAASVGKSEAANLRSRATPEPAVLPIDARRLIDAAGSRAAADALQEEASTAMATRVALAAMFAKGHAPVAIEHTAGPGGHASAFVRGLARLDFAAALRACAEEPDDVVRDAFVEAVALAVSLRRADEIAAAALFDFLSRLDPGLADRFCGHFDHRGFFAAAGRPTALAAIRDCGGPAAESERAWMPDDKLAAEAVLLTRASAWLPQYLRGTK